MKYLVELVFGIGFFGLSAIVITFILRFILLTLVVGLISRIIHGMLGFIKGLIHAVLFIFGSALLGSLIIGFGLQLAENAASGGSEGSGDPTTPILVAFLAFFLIIALRGWQWTTRHNRTSAASPEKGGGKNILPRDELMANAWERAIELAPARRDDLLEARTVCCSLLNAVEMGDNQPDDAMVKTAILIRDNLTSLIVGTERQLTGVSISQKDEIIAEMVRFLLAFGHRARRDLLEASMKIDAQDANMRADLAVKLFK